MYAARQALWDTAWTFCSTETPDEEALFTRYHQDGAFAAAFAREDIAPR